MKQTHPLLFFIKLFALAQKAFMGSFIMKNRL